MKKARPRRTKTAEQRLRKLHKELAALGYICSGTLSHQTRSCGKPTCACAMDPAARHGPYYVWSRRENGRQVNTMLPNEVGPLFEQAVQNYRKLSELLRQWESVSAEAMTAEAPAKPQKKKPLRRATGAATRRARS